MADTRPRGSNADEWLVFLIEHSQEFAAVQIAEAIEMLEKQVLVPCLWRCPTCDFTLISSATSLYKWQQAIGADADLSPTEGADG